MSTTFQNMLTWSAIMVPLLFIAARFGVNAAAGSWIIGFPVVFWLAMRRIARAFDCEIVVLLRPMAAPLALTAASCVMVELAILLGRQRPAPVAQLALEVAIAGASYWVLMRRFARPQYDQVVGLALRVAGRRGLA